MKIKQTIAAGLAAVLIGISIGMPSSDVRAMDGGGGGGLADPSAYSTGGTGKCGKADTAIITCNASDDTKDGNLKNNAIWQVLIIALNVMMAGVGILAVAGIVYGSVLYAAAGDNASQVTKAKGIIMNVVLGLVAFGLMYTLLNFLIPGGVFEQ